MNKEEIKNLIPHREPMLLLDRTELDENGVGHGWYTVPQDPFFCRGHFPGNPMVPGVILCEMMAQSTCQLYPEVFADHLVVYRGLDKVKFRGMVKPGDTCETTCTLVEKKGSIYVCDAKLSVDGKLCAQAQITVALTPKQ
jgi:3-hydroxyacyl-[acyl-carrier-protein] dehydratase